MSGALSGVNILGFTYAGTANFVMRVLGMHGATVVRVESHTRPCNLRLATPFKDGKPGINRSGFYAMANNDRYSIALNLKHPKAPSVSERLIRWADVVFENFTPGTLNKIGLGYKDISTLKPDIIMISISSQGQTGPHSSVASYGPQLQALTGHVNLTGWPDRGPCQIDQSYPDFITPSYAAIAVIGALIHKRRTGKGQYIDCSNLEPSVQWVAPAILDYSVNKHVMMRNGNRVPSAAPHNSYPCKEDDSWCAIAVTNDKEWASFCMVIGKPELKDDPKFTTLPARKSNEEELDRIVADWTINYTATEVTEKMQAAGVSSGKVQSFKDIVSDKQLRHRNYFRPLEHPELGWYDAYAPSYILSRTPAELRLPAPCLGEHTEFVCRELINMSDEEFVELLTDNLFD